MRSLLDKINKKYSSYSSNRERRADCDCSRYDFELNKEGEEFRQHLEGHQVFMDEAVKNMLNFTVLDFIRAWCMEDGEKKDFEWLAAMSNLAHFINDPTYFKGAKNLTLEEFRHIRHDFIVKNLIVERRLELVQPYVLLLDEINRVTGDRWRKDPLEYWKQHKSGAAELATKSKTRRNRLYA